MIIPIVFDPNEKSDGQNPEYVRVHDEYKNLVDYMLGTFMEEMQITPEQFEMACLEGRQNTAAGSAFSFHQGLFQQIWAANDIRIFVRMMTQRNVELQLQALDLIERRHNSSTQKEDETVDEKQVGDVTQEELEQIAADGEDDKIFESVEKEWEDKVDKTETEDEINDKFQRLNLFFEKDNVSKADVQSRQEYLRAQRDKILKIKRKARAYQLNETVKKSGRPSSATQAAQNILESGTANASSNPQNDASVQLRKTLAKRLRTEVVGSE
ncbi:Cilia- and flagella-associated protein 36 [Pseudolycoriella hygida]|uniref:Cilia- and flagella-associated protein 36 n=1 Tax=Pseudolycoriella hygida TaxID=35572 RepID=A0A9Q0RZQ8_9DIPT|nr:Cilia- and flagella-associated protein 36 [Pseudolycoriella hygida]